MKTFLVDHDDEYGHSRKREENWSAHVYRLEILTRADATLSVTRQLPVSATTSEGISRLRPDMSHYSRTTHTRRHCARIGKVDEETARHVGCKIGQVGEGRTVTGKKRTRSDQMQHVVHKMKMLAA